MDVDVKDLYFLLTTNSLFLHNADAQKFFAIPSYIQKESLMPVSTVAKNLKPDTKFFLLRFILNHSIA